MTSGGTPQTFETGEAGELPVLSEAELIRTFNPNFRRTAVALFLAGFSTFAPLYCVQPLLPIFAAEFALTPATASLALSVTTITLGFAMLAVSFLSDAWGRKSLMTGSLLASSLLTLAASFSGSFEVLLVLRALEGLALSGLPAVAMAYLGEEIHPKRLGVAMGIYLAGNAFGGMSGRFVVGLLTDLASWRVALGSIGVFSLAVAICFWLVLPPSRHFHPRTLSLRGLLESCVALFRDPGLPWLFALGFLMMGSFVSIYNYVGFRLLAPPYSLSQTAVGTIFSIYLLGMVASTWAGRLADRLGRRHVLWIAVSLMPAGIALTLAGPLPLIVLGVALATLGYFGSQSISSSWVGRRAFAAKTQGAALFLLATYLGSSLVGSGTGFAWAWDGWTGVAATLLVLQAAALCIALRLRRLQPLPESGGKP